MKYVNAPVEARCPVCDTGSGSLLHDVCSKAAAQHFVLREAEPERHRKLKSAIERLWAGPSCRWVRCGGCAFVYADPNVAGDVDFYTIAYEREHYPADKWEFRKTVSSICRLLDDQAFCSPALLEVGAGDGRFISMVAGDLVDHGDIVCTEYSDYGKTRIEKLGVRCLKQNILTMTPADIERRFDIICLFQVLEHMDDIHGLMRVLGAITSHNAKLFIAVPNDARMKFNELNDSLLDMPPNHVGRWNANAFKVLAAAHGWQVEEHAIEPEGAAAKTKQYVKYRYMRTMQDGRSLANRVERLRASTLKTGLRAALGVAYTVPRLLPLMALVRRSDLGNSQWVQLGKKKTQQA